MEWMGPEKTLVLNLGTSDSSWPSWYMKVKGRAINNYPGTPGVNCMSWSNQDGWPPIQSHVCDGGRTGFARRNLLVKIDSRTFWIQKKKPQGE